MINADKPEKSVKDKTAEWLSNEGYPLEFSTASSFHNNGFQVRQGYYVHDIQSDTPREIDVLAQVTRDVRPNFLRICYVIECKWSGDKPWVVFTSSQHRIAPSACITQTIGSEAGETILWSLAGDKLLQSLDTFHTPTSAGFNGRQAFSKGNDIFYSAMQSVTSAANSLAQGYSRGDKTLQDTLHSAVVIFPIIVLDGILFKASFNEQNGQIDLEDSDQVRIHWRGAETSRFPFTTVDIVTVSKLNDFAKKRYDEAETMLSHMRSSLEQLQECVDAKSLEPLGVLQGPRGVIGLPPLLAKIRALSKEKTDNTDKIIAPPDGLQG